MALSERCGPAFFGANLAQILAPRGEFAPKRADTQNAKIRCYISLFRTFCNDKIRLKLSYEPVGRGFESLPAYQKILLRMQQDFFIQAAGLAFHHAQSACISSATASQLIGSAKLENYTALHSAISLKILFYYAIIRSEGLNPREAVGYDNQRIHTRRYSICDRV